MCVCEHAPLWMGVYLEWVYQISEKDDFKILFYLYSEEIMNMVRLLTVKHVYNGRIVIYPDVGKKKKIKYSLLESEANNVQRGCWNRHWIEHRRKCNRKLFSSHWLDKVNNFYNTMYACLLSCSVMQRAKSHALCDPRTVAHQIPLSMGFSRQEYWSGLSFPPPADLSDPRTEPIFSVSPALAGRFFNTEPHGKPNVVSRTLNKGCNGLNLQPSISGSQSSFIKVEQWPNWVAEGKESRYNGPLHKYESMIELN